MCRPAVICALSALCCALSIAFAAHAAPVYKWTDRDGVVHYSDTPREGAEELNIRAPSSYAPPLAAEPAAAPARTSSSEESARETAVQITSPGSEETLWNIGGQLSVAVSVTPRLLPGHRVALYLDGARVAQGAPGSLSFELNEVWRGEHKLSAVVEAADGSEILRGEPVTFFVRQTSVLN